MPPSHSTPAHALSLLTKLGDADADIRYMSLSDLCNTLDSSSPNFLTTEYHTSAKIIDGIILTLDDQNGEVQNQSIKCVGALVLKLPPDILAPFVHRVTNIKLTHSVDPSVLATALRTFVTSFPPAVPGIPPSPKTAEAYSAVSKVLIPRLLGYNVISSGQDGLPNPPQPMLQIGSEKGVNSDAMDILIDVLRYFGSLLQDSENKGLQTALVAILDDERSASVVKKKAVLAISMLAVYMSDRLLSAFLHSTIERFRAPHLTPSKRRLLISMVGSLSRSVPQRLGPYLKSLAPFVLSALSERELEDYMDDLAEAGIADPEVEEVREAALIALEGFLSSCSNDIRPFTNEAIDSALRYIVYDPNTAADESDEDMGGTQGEEDENQELDGFDEIEDDFEEEGALSDDDDSSWKVRRCAAKALYAIISTRSNGDLLDNGILYEKVAPVLISCFQEREENVRLEILMTLGSLVRKTGEGVTMLGSSPDQDLMYPGDSQRSRKRRRVNSITETFETPGPLSPTIGLSSPAASPSPMTGPKAELTRLSSVIVEGIAKLLKQSSIPTKQAGISLLRDVVIVQNGGLSANIGKIIEPLLDAVKSSNASGGSASTSVGGPAVATGSRMRIEALRLLATLCDTHSSKVLGPHIGDIVPCVILAVKDHYYKVSSDALLTVESVIKTLTPPRSAGTEQQRQTHIDNLYAAMVDRAIATDADLEVRQRAIHALGVLLARTSGSENAKLLPADGRSEALIVLKDRLKNETSRISAVLAIDMVATSAVDTHDFDPSWLREVTLDLGAQLRKADRNLRGTSLNALRNVVSNPVALASLDDDTVQSLAEILLPLVHASDLNLLGLTLAVLGRLVKRSPHKVVDARLNDSLCRVILAPLGGAVFDAFLTLVTVIGEHSVGQPLMHGFLQNVGVSGDPAIVGQTIGTLLVSGSSTLDVKIDDFKTELRTSKDYKRQCLSLSILGEVGLRLGSSSPLEPQIFTAHFSSRSDAVPRAAAVALGRAGAGNVNTYLPVILSYSNKADHLQYLSLHSIKEILQHAGKDRSDISPYTKQIWEMLSTASQTEDNKAIGAECIGRLTIIEPKTFLPVLQEYLRDPKPTVRGMTIQAIRFTFPDNDDAFDEALKPILIKMLTTMLNDPNIQNRRLALGTLNAAIHHKSDMVLPALALLIPYVLKDSKIDLDLIREVQMGPFKHKVDDGLELRKSAYETLYSLIENAYPRMNPRDLFDRVLAGLDDEHEIKMLCNLMLTKLMVLDPEETVRRLDSVAERFRMILSFKPKENSVKQEVEKAAEASKAALKVTVRLHIAFPAVPTPGASLQGHVWKGYYDWLGKEFKGPLHSMEHEVKSQAA